LRVPRGVGLVWSHHIAAAATTTGAAECNQDALKRAHYTRRVASAAGTSSCPSL
jgi:hypothetical protein